MSAPEQAARLAEVNARIEAERAAELRAQAARVAAADEFRQIKHVRTDGPKSYELGEARSVVSALTGAFRQRAARRFGADPDAEVQLEEYTAWGGYSEWTQDNSTEFTLRCGTSEVTFHPDLDDHGSDTWSPQPRAGATVYARLDAWLRATDEPEQLLTEWVEAEPFETSRDGSLRRRLLVPGSLLDVQVRRASRGRVTETYFEQKRDVVAIVAVGGQPGEFRPIQHNSGEFYFGDDEQATARLVVELADDYMPGRPRY